MKRDKRKLMIVAILLISTIGFSGCQLAKPEAQQGKITDRLIGVYLTTEHLDLYDMESFLQDNVNKVVNGKELTATPDYQQRVYAIPSEDKRVDYEFEGIEGISFFLLTYEDENKNITSKVATGNGITDVHISDTDEGRNIEGTLTVGDASLISVYMNPVYQTDDGQIYLMEGSGLSFDGGLGSSTSQSLSETNSYTENDKTVEKSFTVKVNVVTKAKVEAYILKQMNQQDEVIQQTKITQDTIPDKIEKLQDTEYFILEEHSNDLKEGSSVNRKIINGDEKQLTCYFIGENNIAEASYVEIVSEN